MTSRLTRSLVLLSALLLLIGACGNDDDSADTTTTTAGTGGGEDLQECGDLSTSTVETIQEDLKTLGYYEGNIDGECGGETEEALIAFQEAEGLTADGKWGPNTEAAMERALSGGGASTSSTQTTSTQTTSGGSPPCTDEEFQSIAPSGTTVNSVECDAGFAVVDASTPDYDYTLRYEAQGGVWVENDDCADFPPSLQSACNTN